MKTFKDTKNREWSVSVTYGDVRRVESDLNFDLTSLLDDNLESLSRIHSDFALLVGIAYNLCHEQAEKLGVSQEEFGESMGGDTLLHAANAIVEATIDFFPDPSRRKAMRELVARLNRMTELTLSQAVPMALEKMDSEISNMTPEALEKSLSKSFGMPVES